MPEISIWQLQRSEALKSISFGPISGFLIEINSFKRKLKSVFKKCNVVTPEHHILHLLYTKTLVISSDVSDLLHMWCSFGEKAIVRV